MQNSIKIATRGATQLLWIKPGSFAQSEQSGGVMKPSTP